MTEEEVRNLQRKVLDTVSDVLAGTEWSPPDGGIITEMVVIAGWADAEGDYGDVHLRCGSPWGTEGLVTRTARLIEDGDWMVVDEEDDE